MNGWASIHVDPAPGGAEPAAPNGTTIGEGTDAANLQILLLHSPSAATQGSFNLDTVRVGTNWADVTLVPNVLTLTGPQNLAACAGTPPTFSVSVVGAPPFNYHWRTNGTSIANATNSSYTLTTPTLADTAKLFDVVVTDTYAGGNHATVSGTPTMAGTFPFQLKIFDSSSCGSGNSDTRNTSLVVNSSGGGGSPPR